MRNLARSFILLFMLLSSCWAAKTLDMYFLDVEGGQATLIVTPAGQALLVDTGWPGNGDRDTNRILAAAKLAGIKKIDYLLTTHYHTDHIANLAHFAANFPVGTFIDHGSNVETGRAADRTNAQYAETIKKGKRMVVKPGDRIPLKGARVDVVTAHGDTLSKPLKGGGAANPYCEGVARKADDKTENGRSVGFILTFGKFRMANLADVTWNTELQLMCPNNPIGPVDLFLVSHHSSDLSNSPALVHGLQPRVAVANNGAKKGGSPSVYQTVAKSPGLEDLYQLHFALAGGQENNPPEQFIANMDQKCEGHYIKVSAKENGEFTVTNTRNGNTKTYRPRQ